MPAQVHEFEHQGVRGVWADRPGPLQATLAFGVGFRDEPPQTAGITHLMEHVVFRSLGEWSSWQNATTTANGLAFMAFGDPGDVAGFLNRLTGFLADPSIDPADVDAEKRIVEAERPSAVRPDPGMLTYRYGLTGTGVVDAGTPTLGSITAEEIADWIRTWCTADNARLVLSGPPPESLDLRLPRGTRPTTRENVSMLVEPALVASNKGGVALSMVLPRESAQLLVSAVDQVLTRELRSRRALIYSVDSELTAIDDHQDHLAVILDPLDEDIDATARLAVRELRRTAQDGFDDAALEEVRVAARLGLASVQDLLDYLIHESPLVARGLRSETAEHWREVSETVTADELTAVLREALPTLVVAVDREDNDTEDIATDLGLTHVDLRFGEPAKQRGSGRKFRGSGFFKRNWMRISETEVTWREFGDVRTFATADLSVVGRFSDGAVSLIDRTGRDDVLLAEMWPAKAFDELLRHVPDDLVRDLSWIHDRPERPEI